MKFLYAMLLCLSTLKVEAQYIYGSISSGYQLNSKIDQAPSYLVNTIHQVTLPWLCGQENFAFKSSSLAELHFGHMLTPRIGYELTGAYLKPMAVDNNAYFGQKMLSGDFYQAAAKLVVAIPIKEFELYTKLGLNIANGRITYLQTIADGNFNSFGVAEALLNYTYQSPVSFGFNGAVGVNVPLNKKCSFFTELRFTSQSLTPKSGQVSQYTLNGSDLTANLYPYYAQIAFGDESEWLNYTSDDLSQAQKLYKRSYALGGFGCIVGLRVVLWGV
ncbi:MAG: hypothetical protein EAZ48_04070 [Flavobacteriia bacterium]|nr:MAG: hypothetical protein EAZ48_04070 [Flavobacteriia bacterium]